MLGRGIRLDNKISPTESYMQLIWTALGASRVLIRNHAVGRLRATRGSFTLPNNRLRKLAFRLYSQARKGSKMPTIRPSDENGVSR
jgi:hypothetical protein